MKKIVIKINAITDIIELKAIVFLTSSSSTENCLEIRYTTKAVGAEAAMTKELSQ